MSRFEAVAFPPEIAGHPDVRGAVIYRGDSRGDAILAAASLAEPLPAWSPVEVSPVGEGERPDLFAVREDGSLRAVPVPPNHVALDRAGDSFLEGRNLLRAWRASPCASWLLTWCAGGRVREDGTLVEPDWLDRGAIADLSVGLAEHALAHARGMGAPWLARAAEEAAGWREDGGAGAAALLGEITRADELRRADGAPPRGPSPEFFFAALYLCRAVASPEAVRPAAFASEHLDRGLRSMRLIERARGLADVVRRAVPFSTPLRVALEFGHDPGRPGSLR